MPSRKRSASKIDFWESKLFFSFPIACWFFFVRILPRPLSKIKKHFCYYKPSSAGLFKIPFLFAFHSMLKNVCWYLWQEWTSLYFHCFCSIAAFITHCTCAIHLYIGDQGLFLFFSCLSFVWLVRRVILNAPEGSVAPKASVLWVCQATFWASGGWILFIHVQTC